MKIGSRIFNALSKTRSSINEPLKALKRKKIKKDKLPTDSLGIYNINKKTLVKIANVKSYKIPEKWEGYIAYKTSFKSATILGDPIVPDNSVEEAIDDLKENLLSRKYHINFFLCTDKSIDILKRKGFTCFYVGMEAVVDLNKFTIAGRKRWKIRSSVNYAKKNDKTDNKDTYSQTNRSKEIKNEIINRSKDNKIPCAVAFEIAKELEVSTDAVGMTVDLINYRQVKCQL